jgi:DNA modification methylase
MKQKRDRYEMHKYWGKKPSGDLAVLIEKYTKPGDTLLDPFSGYGVFTCEAYLLNRSVITNDLNPIAVFLNEQLLQNDVDLELLMKQWKKIKDEFQPFVEEWYLHKSTGCQITSILRNSEDVPLFIKVKGNETTKTGEIELTEAERREFLNYEDKQLIKDWFPEDNLIQNSRISAKKGMKVSDLFTKRTLACHARLLSLIYKHSSGNEQKLLLVAFTSNLANCSKLVPPIKTRGQMSQGAWMTGFYVGPTYIENNVLRYFENRLKKIVKGKEDYLSELKHNRLQKRFQSNKEVKYEVLSQDAKHLTIETDSVDYVFTDPPYGGAVPYFEQSIIWNSWLGFHPKYEDEVVISDSKERKKKDAEFESDILSAFSEISRVLKKGSYFSLTYHSLSGAEWKAITNACIGCGFELSDFKWLVQKSFTPRQINRAKSVKGDVLVTLKNNYNKEIKSLNDNDTYVLFKSLIQKWLSSKPLDTNEVFLKIMKTVFSDRIIIKDVNLLDLLNKEFDFNEKGLWVNKDE